MQKIVAILNDLEEADLVLERAVKAAKEQRASLEILFVHEAPLFTLPDFFLLLEHKEDNKIDKKKIKEELAQRVKELGFEDASAIFVYIDDTADRVASHTEGDTQTLVVSAYHHSISEEIAKKCYPPLLILKNRHASIKKISLPIELNEAVETCVDLTKRLFPQSTIHLIYDNHYLADKEENAAQKKRFEQLKEKTGLDGDYIEEFAWNEADYGEDFELMEERLSALIRKNSSELTVLCAESGEFLYGEAVSLALLKKLSTDFLFYRHL